MAEVPTTNTIPKTVVIGSCAVFGSIAVGAAVYLEYKQKKKLRKSLADLRWLFRNWYFH